MAYILGCGLRQVNEDRHEDDTNRESFREAFLSRESILLYLLKTYRRGRRRRAELVAGYPHVRLRSSREIARYLREVA